MKPICTDKKNVIIFFNLLVVDTKKGAIYLTVNRSQTAFAIIRHLKPLKFKDVHLNKSPMSAPNNIIESHDSFFSQIVGQLIRPLGLGIIYCDAFLLMRITYHSQSLVYIPISIWIAVEDSIYIIITISHLILGIRTIVSVICWFILVMEIVLIFFIIFFAVLIIVYITID